MSWLSVIMTMLSLPLQLGGLMWLISPQYDGVQSDNDYDNAIITFAAGG
jgi:hypothetical protein